MFNRFKATLHHSQLPALLAVMGSASGGQAGMPAAFIAPLARRARSMESLL